MSLTPDTPLLVAKAFHNHDESGDEFIIALLTEKFAARLRERAKMAAPISEERAEYAAFTEYMLGLIDYPMFDMAFEEDRDAREVLYDLFNRVDQDAPSVVPAPPEPLVKHVNALPYPGACPEPAGAAARQVGHRQAGSREIGATGRRRREFVREISVAVSTRKYSNPLKRWF